MSQILHQARYLRLRALEALGWQQSFGRSLGRLVWVGLGLVWMGLLWGKRGRPCLKELVSLTVSVGTCLVSGQGQRNSRESSV